MVKYMKYFWGIIFICLLCQNGWGSKLENRRNQILEIIDEELKEVSTLSIRGGEKDPDLLLRVAELYLEKARLIRERENAKYLDIPIKKRHKVNKKKYFAKSSRLFALANQWCLKITKRYKRYSRMGEVYYILGFNSKEAGKVKNATKFLSKAGKASSSKKVKVKSILTLADIHFNNRKFSKAKKLYESALKTYVDRWWTKDSFNLAWCYYHLNKHKDAINKMHVIYKRSLNKKFINMRSQVERDIGLFYATSGRIDDGIKFYEKVGVNFSKRLFAIAFTLKSSGKFKKAERVLNHSIKYGTSNNDNIEVSLELLDIFQKSGRYNKHLVVSQKLFKLYQQKKLNSFQVKTFRFQMEKVAAILQRQVLGKTYRRLKKQRKLKYKQTSSYFEMLSIVSAKRYDEYQYLKGETAYAMGYHQVAFNAYKNTFEYSQKNNKHKFQRKSMDNMLVSLTRLGKRSDLRVYTFEKFIQHYPKDKNLKKIYERLFNNYIARKEYPLARKTLDKFAKRFPKDFTQEAMIAKLMDIDRKRGDNNAVRAWVVQIEAGDYFVSAKYKNKLQELLTTMQMEDVQGELKKGNKQVALVGYHKVLKDKYSTKRSKINAKYNLAALYFELGDVDNAFKWSMSAIEEMQTADVLKFQKSFITIANFLFMSLAFDKSSRLSEKILVKTCSTKSKRKNLLLRNAGYIGLANGDLGKVENIRSLGQKCRVNKKYLYDLDFEIMRESYLRKKYNKYEAYVTKLAKEKKFARKLIDEYLNLYEINKEFDNRSKMSHYLNKARSAYMLAKKKRKSISIRALDYFANIEHEKMLSTAKKIDALTLRFPENVFQKLVEKHIGLLDKLVEQANDVIQIGSGDAIMKAYATLHSAYNIVAKRLDSFVPPGKTKAYLAGFKKQFTIMSKQMYGAAASYKKEAVKSMRKNEILSGANFYFQNNKVPVKFFGPAMIMDRRGGK